MSRPSLRELELMESRFCPIVDRLCEAMDKALPDAVQKAEEELITGVVEVFLTQDRKGLEDLRSAIIDLPKKVGPKHPFRQGAWNLLSLLVLRMTCSSANPVAARAAASDPEKITGKVLRLCQASPKLSTAAILKMVKSIGVTPTESDAKVAVDHLKSLGLLVAEGNRSTLTVTSEGVKFITITEAKEAEEA